MSKRNSDGDVLFNRLAVNLAKEESLLGSLLGSNPISVEERDQREQEDDRDLDVDDADDNQFGVGAKIPKDIQDGSFTSRVPASYDKLLQQLIGSKAAKAHLAAKRTATSHAMPKKRNQPAPIAKEESDEELEGRSSAFKSKRRRVATTQKANVDAEEEDAGEDDPDQLVPAKKAEKVAVVVGSDLEEGGDVTKRKPNAPESRPQKPKTGSYLDEILAHRSKKKKKNKSKLDA